MIKGFGQCSWDSLILESHKAEEEEQIATIIVEKIRTGFVYTAGKLDTPLKHAIESMVSHQIMGKVFKL